MTEAVYIIPRYARVGTNVSNVFLLDVGLSDICWKKYFSFFKVDYLGSSKAEVRKFATLSWHSQRESEIIKSDQISN